MRASAPSSSSGGVSLHRKKTGRPPSVKRKERYAGVRLRRRAGPSSGRRPRARARLCSSAEDGPHVAHLAPAGREGLLQGHHGILLAEGEPEGHGPRRLLEDLVAQPEGLHGHVQGLAQVPQDDLLPLVLAPGKSFRVRICILKKGSPRTRLSRLGRPSRVSTASASLAAPPHRAEGVHQRPPWLLVLDQGLRSFPGLATRRARTDGASMSTATGGSDGRKRSAGCIILQSLTRIANFDLLRLTFRIPNSE